MGNKKLKTTTKVFDDYRLAIIEDIESMITVVNSNKEFLKENQWQVEQILKDLEKSLKTFKLL